MSWTFARRDGQERPEEGLSDAGPVPMTPDGAKVRLWTVLLAILRSFELYSKSKRKAHEEFIAGISYGQIYVLENSF